MIVGSSFHLLNSHGACLSTLSIPPDQFGRKIIHTHEDEEKHKWTWNDEELCATKNNYRLSLNQWNVSSHQKIDLIGVQRGFT